MSSIHFELVSPEQKLISEPVTMAVIPAEKGEMGVGQDHTSMLVSLKAGVVKLYSGNRSKVDREIFIAGGFADITGEQCTLLAEEAVNVKELDKAALEQELKDLNEDLGLAEEAIDKARVQKRIDLAEEKLFAIAHMVAA